MEIKDGQSASVTFVNSGDKSAFVDIVYNNAVTKKTDKAKIGFYVYNTNTPKKVFDMSEAEKVLLPQSAQSFNTILVAEGGDF